MLLFLQRSVLALADQCLFNGFRRFFKFPAVKSSRKIVKYLLSESSCWPWVESVWFCMMEVWRKMEEEIILFFTSKFHPGSILNKGMLILKSQGFSMLCLYDTNRAVCITKSLITWAHTVQWNTVLPELTDPNYSISRVLSGPVITRFWGVVAQSLKIISLFILIFSGKANKI